MHMAASTVLGLGLNLFNTVPKALAWQSCNVVNVLIWQRHSSHLGVWQPQANRTPLDVSVQKNDQFKGHTRTSGRKGNTRWVPRSPPCSLPPGLLLSRMRANSLCTLPTQDCTLRPRPKAQPSFKLLLVLYLATATREVIQCVSI